MSKTAPVGTDFEISAGSILPEDLLTFTDADDLGIGGFVDMEYGSGTFDREVLGEDRHETSLPDGLAGVDHTASADPFDSGLGDTDFFNEAEAVSGLTDLSWLSLSEQDMARLPKSHNNIIPELEDAWGKGRSTTGINIVPGATDRTAAVYRASMEQPKSKNTKTASEIASVVRAASRKLTAGEPTTNVLATVATALHGTDTTKLAAALTDDAGLIGKVFIRAANYPGCDSGKWSTDKVHKQANAARYVVAKDTCAGCVHAQNGSCQVFKKQIVASVPWKAAADIYSPKLEVTGRKLASGTDPKEALRAAFQAPVQKLQPVASTLPTHQEPADRITKHEAKTAFNQMPNPEVQVLASESPEKRLARITKKVAGIEHSIKNGFRGQKLLAHIVTAFNDTDRALALSLLDPIMKQSGVLADSDPVKPYSGTANDTRVASTVSMAEAWGTLQKRANPTLLDISDRAEAIRLAKVEKNKQAVQASLTRWHQEGMLDTHTYNKLSASTASPSDVLKIAMGSLSKRTYTVQGKPIPAQKIASASEVSQALKLAEQELAQKTAAIYANREETAVQIKVAKIKAEIDRGIRGHLLTAFIKRHLTASEVGRAAKYLNPILKATAALTEPATKHAAYTDKQYVPHTPKQASTAPLQSEVRGLIKWARTQMTEGWAGKELTQLIQQRFTPSVIQASTEQLQAVRTAHEGLAGHAYVDTAVYASQAGTTGCGTGALKHRANAIPALLQMDRCGSCAKRSMREDGTAVCQVYNKPLITAAAEIIDGDPKRYAREMIRLANGSDIDRTTALFAAPVDKTATGEFDEDEFQLASVLDGELDIREASLPDLPQDIFFDRSFMDMGGSGTGR